MKPCDCLRYVNCSDSKGTLRSLAVGAICCLLLLPGTTLGTILDQAQEDSNGAAAVYATRFVAQTFTPATSGQLEQVDLAIDTLSGLPTYPATISIVGTVGGEPSGAVLGAVSVPGFSMGWNSVSILSQAIYLTAGVQYAILLSNDDPDLDAEPTDWWRIRWDVDPYAGGACWKWGPASGWEWCNWSATTGASDAAFRTWMVPEPASFSLLGLGGLILLRNRRR